MHFNGLLLFIPVILMWVTITQNVVTHSKEGMFESECRMDHRLCVEKEKCMQIMTFLV